MDNELILNTHVGSEIDVTVYFDYSPSEPVTRVDPGCESSVTINAVYVDWDEGKDILEVLDVDCQNRLELQCLEAVESAEEPEPECDTIREALDDKGE